MQNRKARKEGATDATSLFENHVAYLAPALRPLRLLRKYRRGEVCRNPADIGGSMV